MKLINLLNKKGNPYWITGATRDDLPELFKDLSFKKGAEIGVSWAQNIIGYCKAGFEIYGIDPWKDSEDNIYRKIVSIEGKYAKTIDTVYAYAIERTKTYPNCTLIRKTSMEALNDFPDRSLDFIYIDANHYFGYIAMDLMKWSQKVKRGGIIAGHDYFSTEGVRQVRFVGPIVDAFAKSFDFENFYVLGSKKEKRGIVRDRDLSYFFIKHWEYETNRCY